MGGLAEGAHDLRSRAEAALRRTERDVSSMIPDDVQRLVHELQVHQIELEMQNEELRRAHAKLEESREQFQELFERAPAAYLDVDADGVIVRANRGFSNLLDVDSERLPGRRVLEFVAPQDLRRFREHLRAVLESEERGSCELSVVRDAGSTVQVRLDSSPRRHGCLMLMTDISERKRAEGALFRLAQDLEERVELRTSELADKNRQLQFEMAERSRAEQERQQLETRLRSAERLEGLAQLAGGIAHDFNNLLVGVLGNADLLLGEKQLPPAMRESLSLIKQAGQAATDLTRQMLMYTGRAQRVVQPVDVVRIIEGCIESARPQAPEGVRLVNEMGPNLPAVMADEGQLRELVTHLIMNALEAVGELGPGRVAVRAYAVDFDEQELGVLTVRANAAPGRYVVIAVDDTGHGMDASMQARAFDPFFSTKFTGRGLGLASVLGVVRGHHGALNLWSEPGHGTSIQVALPAAAREQIREPAPRSELWTGSGSVLLIDDDQLVRGVLSRLLQHMGFSHVVQAATGREGLDRYTAPGQRFSVVVLDRTMPGLSGEQVLAKLRELDPLVPVLMVSGYSADDIDVDDPRVRFLQKPMTEDALRESLADLIEGTAAGVRPLPLSSDSA